MQGSRIREARRYLYVCHAVCAYSIQLSSRWMWSPMWKKTTSSINTIRSTTSHNQIDWTAAFHNCTRPGSLTSAPLGGQEAAPIQSETRKSGRSGATTLRKWPPERPSQWKERPVPVRPRFETSANSSATNTVTFSTRVRLFYFISYSSNFNSFFFSFVLFGRTCPFVLSYHRFDRSWTSTSHAEPLNSNLLVPFHSSHSCPWGLRNNALRPHMHHVCIYVLYGVKWMNEWTNEWMNAPYSRDARKGAVNWCLLCCSSCNWLNIGKR